MFPVLKGKMLIGHSPQCTIHIDSLAVDEKHAEIETNNQHVCTLRDLGSESGTFVNQNRVEEQTLKDGDVIRVGKHTLNYTHDPSAELVEAEPVADTSAATEAAASEAPGVEEPAVAVGEGQRTAWLQILSGQNLGKTLSLNRSITNLGKPGVATAVIARRGEGYFISHLEGSVAPQVGDQKIGDESHKLDDGDVIQIGNIKMQFYYE